MMILAHGDPNTIWMFPVALLVWAGLAYCIYRFCRAVYENRLRARFLTLRPELTIKLSALPPPPSGEYCVTLVLSNLRKVSEVTVISGVLCKVGGRWVCRRSDLDFKVEDIIDVFA
jgi:hypothetical protein